MSQKTGVRSKSEGLLLTWRKAKFNWIALENIKTNN